MESRTALLVGLDVEQRDACAAALERGAPGVGVLFAVDAGSAIDLLSKHRSSLVVMSSDLALDGRRMIAELAGCLDARLASLAPTSSPASIERLIDGFASIAFPRLPESKAIIRTAGRSGVRPKVGPGSYSITAEPARKRKAK